MRWVLPRSARDSHETLLFSRQLVFDLFVLVHVNRRLHEPLEIVLLVLVNFLKLFEAVVLPNGCGLPLINEYLQEGMVGHGRRD